MAGELKVCPVSCLHLRLNCPVLRVGTLKTLPQDIDIRLGRYTDIYRLMHWLGNDITNPATEEDPDVVLSMLSQIDILGQTLQVVPLRSYLQQQKDLQQQEWL